MFCLLAKTKKEKQDFRDAAQKKRPLPLSCGTVMWKCLHPLMNTLGKLQKHNKYKHPLMNERWELCIYPHTVPRIQIRILGGAGGAMDVVWNCGHWWAKLRRCRSIIPCWVRETSALWRKIRLWFLWAKSQMLGTWKTLPLKMWCYTRTLTQRQCQAQMYFSFRSHVIGFCRLEKIMKDDWEHQLSHGMWCHADRRLRTRHYNKVRNKTSCVWPAVLWFQLSGSFIYRTTVHLAGKSKQPWVIQILSEILLMWKKTLIILSVVLNSTMPHLNHFMVVIFHRVKRGLEQELCIGKNLVMWCASRYMGDDKRSDVLRSLYFSKTATKHKLTFVYVRWKQKVRWNN